MKLILVIFWFILFVWALIDIIQARKEFFWKLVWIAICFIFPIGGVIGYYFIGHKKALESKNNSAPTV